MAYSFTSGHEIANALLAKAQKGEREIARCVVGEWSPLRLTGEN